MEITIAGTVHQVEITYKRIKNMYLRVDAEGTIHVSCSKRVSLARITEFIRSKESWIANAQVKQEKRSSKVRTGTDGYVTWLGEEYPCEIEISARARMKFENGKVILGVKYRSPEEIERVFYYFAGKELVKLIEERRGEWDQKICHAYRKAVPSITVRYMTSRWGSCTAANASIRISTRLIHYPVVCLESVLLHEYVHMLVQDHSQKFYSFCTYFMPDYRQREKLLK